MYNLPFTILIFVELLNVILSLFHHCHIIKTLFVEWRLWCRIFVSVSLFSSLSFSCKAIPELCVNRTSIGNVEGKSTTFSENTRGGVLRTQNLTPLICDSCISIRMKVINMENLSSINSRILWLKMFWKRTLRSKFGYTWYYGVLMVQVETAIKLMWVSEYYF